MKKLSFKNFKLGADDMLQRNQLKSILGGYGGSCQSWIGGVHYTGISVSDAQGDYAWCLEQGYSNCRYCCASC